VTRAVVLLASAAAVLVALAALRSRRELSRWLGADPLRRLRVARAGLMIVAIVATADALLRAASAPPRLGGASADVLIVFDVSRSMDAQDAPPSRLRRAVRLAERFVEQAEGLRLGLVVFAGAAFPVLPLTQDRDALLTYLRTLDTELVSRPGTDLADALRTAAAAFDPGSSRPRAVLLLTDGEHGGAGLGGVVAELRASGISVVSVGVGTPEGAIVPGPGGELRDARGQAVLSRRVDATLEEISLGTGGAVRLEAHAPDPGRLIPSPPPLSGALGEGLAPAPLSAGLAALALALEVALSSPLRRRTPRRAAGAVATLAGASLLLLAAGPRSWIEEGDRALARGEPREALSLYRRAERAYGPLSSTQIRVGNALYRLGALGLASGTYLETLRAVAADERDVRFVAAFNLGTALLAQERYDEARDALWTALIARPESLEAKFNYEWALERVAPQEPETHPVPESSGPEPEESSGEAPARPEGSSAAGEGPSPTDLTREEAREWLRSIEEEPSEPLRDQIARRLEGGRRRRDGQTW
jgi:Ca-activated chloride channel family protein